MLSLCEGAELNIERRRTEELGHKRKPSEIKGTPKERKGNLEMNER